MDVMVSTVSSETCVVGAGGCGNSSSPDPECLQNRGGEIFYPYGSSSWDLVGRYSLGADRELDNYGYADYGLDTLTVGVAGPNVTSSIIGAFNGTSTINNTYYITWLFGLGLGTGTFNNDITPVPALNALVQTEGKVPGNSYGFTAGAHYQRGGEPNSLTLGGYDAARLVWHNVTFALNAAKLPQTFVQGISMFSAKASSNFTNSSPLLTTAGRVNAIIDSSTPYLWLPQSVCDKFATALGLVYDHAVNLYAFGGTESNRDALDKSHLFFNFTLSDPASKGGIINIVIPYKAFVLQLRYPAIPNTTYGAANSTRNYFPLRPASNDAQYRIGRAFLQEAYIITDYDRSSFGVYQAVHPSDPFGSANLITINPPSTSLFGDVPSSNTKISFSIGANVGLVIGAIFLIVLVIFTVFFIFHRRRIQKTDDKSVKKSIGIKPRTLLDRLRGRPRETIVYEASGSTDYPTEVGADATHERVELPAPLGPAELDSDSGTWEGTTEKETQDSPDLSA
ncbi:acid protease [Hyaloscypha hepaticicola]|uniref:Acid protease n=1 Tax=Hyaloscypha hepaticicola TaxID=2082293 RepID=A0A2J6PRC8_9HELO|nr:acid protease [Hyaloscypha hepaticicola]